MAHCRSRASDPHASWHRAAVPKGGSSGTLGTVDAQGLRRDTAEVSALLPPGSFAVIDEAGLDALIGELRARGYTVIGPQVRDDAIVLDEIEGIDDLPVGVGDEQEPARYRVVPAREGPRFSYAVGPQSLRRYLSPPRVSLFAAQRENDGDWSVQPSSSQSERYAFVGARACDLAAVAVQDRVFADCDHPDPGYVRAREAAFFVAVHCAEPASTCFCSSMGTGPRAEAGFDLALSELVGESVEYLVEVGSEHGAEVLEPVARRAATVDDHEASAALTERAVERMQRHVDPLAARDVLATAAEHPRWDDVASRCLSCSNCTLVCPTCFCSTVEDVTDLAGDHAERVLRWDSCFTSEHSALHGGPVRSDIRSRYRQWLTHKLSTWWDQFDVSGCVGCGRCITWCPAGIDITEEVAAIAEGTS